MIILQYSRFEQSYDRFHSEADNIYRVILEFTTSTGVPQYDAAVYAPLAEVLKREYPEVRSVVRITPEYSKVVFTLADQMTEVDRIYYTDSTFFSLFDFKVITGDPASALRDPNTIVLTKTIAEKYFGPLKTWTESPLNKMIVMNNKRPLKITAIIDDIPVNSHFTPNALISFTTFIERSDPSKEWGWNDFYTYVLLSGETDYKQFEAKLPAIVTKYKEKDSKDRFLLQPLKDIHLHSNVGFELNPNGNAQTVNLLSLIAIVILVVAWVNYINLATARAGRRAKEIGVRKVNGATRSEVMTQFMLESCCMNFIALVIALALVYTVMPMVRDLLGKPLEFSLLSDRTFLLYSVSIYIVGCVASGLYPALVLSSFKPVSIFRSSQLFTIKGNKGLREALVVFQFLVSAGLITGTLIIFNQMEFIQNMNLGYSSNNTIILSASSTQEKDSLNRLRYYTFRENLLNYPQFHNVAISSVVPGKSHNDLDTSGGLHLQGDSKVSHSLTSFRVDENFINLFDLKIVAGRNFTDQYTKGTEQLILNRAAAELFGFNDPNAIIGKKIEYLGEIVGVIENYHHKSLRNRFEPTILRHTISGMLYVTVKLDPNASLKSSIEKLKNEWESIYPNDPFVYFFLEDHVKAQYENDRQFSKTFNIFAAFSMLISCLGLFGLVSYSVSTKIKEIGVRKVLGASIMNIMLLFGKGYFRLLAIAFVIGIPLASYILGLWVDNFAYKASIGWITFVVPVVVVTMLSLVAISFEVIKAALMNPVKSLRE